MSALKTPDPLEKVARVSVTGAFVDEIFEEEPQPVRATQIPMTVKNLLKFRSFGNYKY